MGRIPTFAVAGLLLFMAGCGKTTITTPSGLKYAELAPGTGEPVTTGDVVEFHYTGWLQEDGTRFESSHDGNTPRSFVVGVAEMVPGLDEGIAGMRVGGKRKLYVPAKLAFGEQGHSLLIPPNADLIYEVELLRVGRVLTDDLKVGEGDMAVQWGDIVEVRFTTRLKDGEQDLESNVSDANPLRFKVGRYQPEPEENLRPVLKGWHTGVLGMKLGGKRKLTVPAALAHGDKGVPGVIPPNADLVFEMELVSIAR